MEVNLEEMTAINVQLEDLRDAAARLRCVYDKAWLRDKRLYWLGNMLVRYDNLAGEFPGKIVAERDSQAIYWKEKTLPPQQLGFYLKP